MDEIRKQMPEMPRERRNRLKGEWNFSDIEMRDVVNADALDLIEETVKLGATPAGAKKWWLGELSREANAKGVALEELDITPQAVADVERLIADGKLTDKLAKQTVAFVLKGEGTPEQVVAAHGFKVVSDDGALQAAVQEAVRAQGRRHAGAGRGGPWLQGRLRRWGAAGCRAGGARREPGCGGEAQGRQHEADGRHHRSGHARHEAAT